VGLDKPTASMTSVLRVINERAVYERIRLNGPVSRPEVAKATGLSKPTISLALADLEKVGLVRTVGHRTGGAGRAAVLYEIHPGAGWVLGALAIGLTITREIVFNRAVAEPAVS
jgi:predicted transcriptional regulator